MVRKQDQIRGCLLGAASGDALGCAVETLTLEEILERFGPGGIQGYDTINGYAHISCNTQQALFTANGLLFGATRGATRGVMAPYVKYLEAFYRDWAATQRYVGRQKPGKTYAWLCCVEQLRCRRNPDQTMLFCLDRDRVGTLEEPVNRSRNHYGLTRSIPIGLFLDPRRTPRPEIALLGAEGAALTVGDPLGFLPAAYLTDLLSRIVYDKPESFQLTLRRTMEAMAQQFGSRFPQTAELNALLGKVLTTTEEPREVLEQLHPEDAASVLASACYVCLKFPGDFDRGIVASVNHSGLSAAVGTVAGALLGAMLSTEGVPEFYLEPLEMREILEELADDLFQGCSLSRDGRLFDDQWDQKYVQCTY